MFILVLLTLAQCDLVIKEGEFFRHMYAFNGNYTIVSRKGHLNFTRYSYKIEQNVHLTFSKEEFIYNGRNVNIVGSNGIVSPPPLVRQLFTSPVCFNTSYPLYTKVLQPSLQLCYNFTTERITLKVVIGILVLLIIALKASEIIDVVENNYRNLKMFMTLQS